MIKFIKNFLKKLFNSKPSVEKTTKPANTKAKKRKCIYCSQEASMGLYCPIHYTSTNF